MVREEGLRRAYGSDSARRLRLFYDWRDLIYGNTYDLERTADHPREFSRRSNCRGCPIRCRHRTIPSHAFRLSGS